MAKDCVISTVDPQARHGHKSRERRFDGYKPEVAVLSSVGWYQETCPE